MGNTEKKICETQTKWETVRSKLLSIKLWMTASKKDVSLTTSRVVGDRGVEDGGWMLGEAHAGEKRGQEGGNGMEGGKGNQYKIVWSNVSQRSGGSC